MKLEEEIQTEKFKSPYNRAALNIIFTGNWLTDRWNLTFKQFDISQQQYNVLRILRGQKGNALNLKDIQGRMIHRNSNVTRLVEKLRLKELVDRIVCENNRRKVEISITQKGMDLLEKLDPIIDKNEKKLFTSLSGKEATKIGTLLDKLRE